MNLRSREEWRDASGFLLLLTVGGSFYALATGPTKDLQWAVLAALALATIGSGIVMIRLSRSDSANALAESEAEVTRADLEAPPDVEGLRRLLFLFVTIGTAILAYIALRTFASAAMLIWGETILALLVGGAFLGFAARRS